MTSKDDDEFNYFWTCIPVQIRVSTHAQTQVPVAFIVFERSSGAWVNWRYQNTTVDENILLLFRRDENGDFSKRISVNGAQDNVIS